MTDFPNGSDWFAGYQKTAMLRPGPHVTALYAERYAAGWCDNCGRRRGADARCAACDPWWTSPFYVYGSLLTVGVTLFMLLTLPLLRPHTNDSRPFGQSQPALLAAPAAFSASSGFSAPVAPPQAMYPAASVVAAVTAPHPAFHPPIVPPPATPDPALADLARLRAMTDFAAGVETRREAARALAVPLPSTAVRLPGYAPTQAVSAPPVPVAAPSAVDTASPNLPNGEGDSTI